MKKLDQVLKNEIESLIGEIEQKTTGEIVPVVLARSDSYPAAHFRLALLLSIILPLGLYMAPLSLPDPIWFLAAQALAIFLGLILAFHPRFKRLMLTKGEISEEVHQRALEAFYHHGVGNTSDRDGVLLFISLMEKRAEILADIGIAKNVSNDEWSGILKNTLKELKAHKIESALLIAIREIGDKLTQHFPRKDEENSAKQSNQLDDHVRSE